MTDRLCFNKTQFLATMSIAVIALSLVYYQEQRENEQKVNRWVRSEVKKALNDKSAEIKPAGPAPTQPNSEEVHIIHETPVAVRDILYDHDVNKLHDPLQAPTKRVPRHLIPPTHLKQFIDIPTRGYPDNYQQLGVLIRDDSGLAEGEKPESDNRVIRLFGRQTYPGSHKYEYYTMIPDGLDRIKMPLDVNRNQELYDDDVVTVDLLGKDYKIRLYKNEGPRYLPDIW